MSAKVEFTLGALSFTSEGDESWVAIQLDKILELSKNCNLEEKFISSDEPKKSTLSNNGGAFNTSLAIYLKAEKNQNQRFLITADWLRLRGASILTSGAVAKALSSNHQSRLGNPSDCLNQNIRKGFCEKQGDGFFITPEGLKHLGHE